jgi:hypothetical protein
MFLSEMCIRLNGGEQKWVLMTEETLIVVVIGTATAGVLGAATAVPGK